MKSIGGYFELELQSGIEYHNTALKLNTCHNAFEHLLRSGKYSKVYIPYFTCHIMAETARKSGVEVEFYYIDNNFVPLFDFTRVTHDEVFLYTNYFGLCDKQVSYVAGLCGNLVLDNAQAFYTIPIPGVDTIYSARKYFGVPDGAYLYPSENVPSDLEQDYSLDRFLHLLGRIDKSAEEYLEIYRLNESILSNQPVKRMSQITQRLLQGINYEVIRETRRNNFKYLHTALGGFNSLGLNLETEAVPLVYPLLTARSELRAFLIRNKVYTPVYWPNVTKWCNEGEIEFYYASNLISLPVDQRYSGADMQRIIDLINKFM